MVEQKVISKKQRILYDWLVKFINEYNRSPVYGEIMAAFDYKSYHTPSKYIKALQDAGLLVKGRRNAIIQLAPREDLPPDLRRLIYSLNKCRMVGIRDPAEGWKATARILVDFIGNPIVTEQFELILKGW